MPLRNMAQSVCVCVCVCLRRGGIGAAYSTQGI